MAKGTIGVYPTKSMAEQGRNTVRKAFGKGGRLTIVKKGAFYVLRGHDVPSVWVKK